MEAVTINEARAHFEERIKLFEAERDMIWQGGTDKAFWATNRGTDAAFDLLADMITAYRRVLKIIDAHEKREAER